MIIKFIHFLFIFIISYCKLGLYNKVGAAVEEKHFKRKQKAISFQLSTCLINGVIRDASTNKGIRGVNVVYKGISKGAVTDAKGRFSFHQFRKGTLLISCVGFKSKEIKITKSTLIEIFLDTEIHLLDEIVIVGYGLQKKSDLGSYIIIPVNEPEPFEEYKLVKKNILIEENKRFKELSSKRLQSLPLDRFKCLRNS